MVISTALVVSCSKEVKNPSAAPEEPPAEPLELLSADPAPVDIAVEESSAPVIDRSSQVSILGYHDFTETGRPTQMKIRASKFREQMKALKEAEIPVVSMSDYLAWRRGVKSLPKQCVVITADDGWREFHTYALPVLKEFGYPFTMYLYTNYLNIGGRSLSDDQVRDLLAANGEIGSHSLSHKDMTRRRAFPTDEAYDEWLLAELKESKEILEKRFDVKITSFAYPFGAYNDRIVKMVQELGYEAAVTVNGAKAGYESPMGELPRYIIHGDNDTNWRAATSFRGSGGLAGANNLLKPKKNESGEMQESLVKTWPEDGQTIDERRPEIQVDLSRLEGVDPDSVAMSVSGFGKVPAVLNPDTKVLSWRVLRKIRTEECSVSVKLKRLGEPKPDVMNWSFKVNRMALYLKDPDKVADADGAARASVVEAVEIRRPLPVNE